MSGRDLIDRSALKEALDQLIVAASRSWGVGSTEHNLVRDIADIVARAPSATPLRIPEHSDTNQGKR